MLVEGWRGAGEYRAPGDRDGGAGGGAARNGVQVARGRPDLRVILRGEVDASSGGRMSVTGACFSLG